MNITEETLGNPETQTIENYRDHLGSENNVEYDDIDTSSDEGEPTNIEMVDDVEINGQPS